MRAEETDSDRFRLLFDDHFDDLWRFARRRCDSGATADDVVAQVFAAAWRRRDDLPEAAERLWLFGAARRVLANDRRSTVRRERLRSKLAFHRVADADPVAIADVAVPSLDELSPDEREAVRLRYWDDLSVAEIATLLDCTANAVSLRLHRARRKLLASLEGKDLLGDGHVASEPGTKG